MRMLLRVSIPVEAGNAAAKAGTLGSTVEKILADLKPELRHPMTRKSVKEMLDAAPAEVVSRTDHRLSWSVTP